MGEPNELLMKYLDAKFDGVHEKLDAVSKRLDGHEEKHTGADKRLDVVEADIAKVRTVGGFIGATAGLGATIIGIWHTLRGE